MIGKCPPHYRIVQNRKFGLGKSAKIIISKSDVKINKVPLPWFRVIFCHMVRYKSHSNMRKCHPNARLFKNDTLKALNLDILALHQEVSQYPLLFLSTIFGHFPKFFYRTSWQHRDDRTASSVKCCVQVMNRELPTCNRESPQWASSLHRFIQQLKSQLEQLSRYMFYLSQ